MAISERSEPRLPPPPDFRYVGLSAGGRVPLGVWAGLSGSVAGAWATSLVHGGAARGLVAGAAIAACTAIAMWTRARPSRAARYRGRPSPMAIVPWGVLVEQDERSRVIHWAGIKSIDVDMVYGRDQATPTTLFSIVTIDTGGERLTGTTRGAVAIDRLLVHLDAYASEAAQAVALDLDGERPSGGPFDADVEPLLSAALSYVDSGPASQRLELAPGDYRHATSHVASARASEHLRAVLRDRTPRPVDPRAFAAILAAELAARDLADDLVALVQSPHPVLAAVAKAAAHKLGVHDARIGGLDEVAPFLAQRDLDALRAWSEAH